MLSLFLVIFFFLVVSAFLPPALFVVCLSEFSFSLRWWFCYPVICVVLFFFLSLWLCAAHLRFGFWLFSFGVVAAHEFFSFLLALCAAHLLFFFFLVVCRTCLFLLLALCAAYLFLVFLLHCVPRIFVLFI